METRTVEQIKIYKLILNPILGKYEDEGLVATSASYEALDKFFSGEQVEMYKDQGYNKGFRKGGLLEWFNASRYNSERGLIEDEWVDQEVFDRIKIYGNFIG